MVRKSHRWIPIAILATAALIAGSSARAGERNQIRAVTVEEGHGATLVRVRGSQTPTFTVYKLERPTRVVVDVASADLAEAVRGGDSSAVWTPGTWAVGQIAAQQVADAGSIVRIVVTLARPGRYDVKAEGRDLIVTVTARDAQPPSAAPDAAELQRARAEAAQAKDQAQKAAAAQAAADQGRAAAEAEADKARAAAAGARAEAERARATATAEADRAKQAQAAAETAQRDARRALADRAADAAAQTDAHKSAEKALAAARAEAEQARRAAVDAQAQAVKARAAAEAETAKAKVASEAARVEAEKARTEAAAEAERVRRTAAAEADQARQATRAAQAEAQAARQAADRDRKLAETARVEADRILGQARTRLADIDGREQAARAEKARADDARKAADARELAARTAEARAAQERKEAEAAAQKAATARDSAGARVAADRARLESEARAAEERLHKAEEARAGAERARAAAAAQAAAARKDAEQARAVVASAESDRAAAEKAKASAERDRSEAERAGSAAEQRRVAAEAERVAAEQRKQSAEAAAAEAAQRAERARGLRKDEETAAARAATARADAETRRDAAARAAAELEASLAAAQRAGEVAQQRQRAAVDARKVADDAARRKAGQDEIAAARAEATRLERERQTAQAALADRTQDVERRQKQVAQLDAARDAASVEVTRLKTSADDARTARQREEALLADVAARRVAAEKDLEKIRHERDEAEAGRAAAESAKSKADRERLAAEAAKSVAESARLAAEAARSKADQDRVAADAARGKAEHDRAAAEAARVMAIAATSAKSPPAPTAKPAASPVVKDVRYVHDRDGGNVVVDLGGVADARVVSTTPRRAELVIDGAALPDSLQRTLDTSRFHGAVRAVSSFRDRQQAGRVRVVVELNEPATANLEKVGRTLQWRFASSRTASATPSRARSIPSPVVGGYGASSTPITQKSIAQVNPGNGRRVYRGTTVDLDFKEAPIHDLLRLLSDVGRVNIVVPDDIKANVTVRMKRVPWDQALEVILSSKGLWYRREGNLIRVAPRKQLDAEDEAEAERRKAAVESEAPEPEVMTLNYASADELASKLTPMLSPKGKVEVDSRTNSLIVSDLRAHRRRISELAVQLDTQTPQISIEARVVEARSNYKREIGIQWGGRATASQQTGNATGLQFPSSITAGGAEDNDTNRSGTANPSDFAVNLPAAVGTGSGGALGLALGSVSGNYNINLRLSALEDTGTVRIISAPKITVLNNTKATISQGVRIPISVVSAQGTQTQFVSAELSLEVQPYVSQRDCAIAMDINVTKNEPDFVNVGARGDPTILSKEARTRILVGDGETTVLGGIYTRNTGLSYSKVPFFGDIPVLGWFFKQRSENDDRTEVLVFITPKITNKAFLRCQ